MSFFSAKRIDAEKVPGESLKRAGAGSQDFDIGTDALDQGAENGGMQNPEGTVADDKKRARGGNSRQLGVGSANVNVQGGEKVLEIGARFCLVRAGIHVLNLEERQEFIRQCSF